MGKLRIVNNIVEDYTIVLSTRDKRHLGQLAKLSSINDKESLNAPSEISFSIYKYDLLKQEPFANISNETHMSLMLALWEQIEDLKLIWVKELNAYYEIKVSIEDSAETIKTITGTSLCEAELSQININSLEVNSESDILRDDYVVTTFYNATNPKASLLNRILSDKAPHYKIKYVDDSLKNIQRTFSVSGSDIYSFLTGEVSEQFNCLFRFDSSDRSISAYDLYTVCEDCGYRGDYYDECPECGSKNLKYFGEDTTILVDKNNLTDSIHLESNADSIKNCFKLEAGDELMTATVRMLNQNGSDYLYQIPEYQKRDMPDELVSLIESYNRLYDSYTEEYQELVGRYYDYIDEILYLESSMMPTVEEAEVTSATEAAKINDLVLDKVGLSSVTTATSVATVNSALKNYVKLYVKTGYVKVEVADGAKFTYGGDFHDYHIGTWKGRFIVTNYSDKEDVTMTDELNFIINDDYETFIRQKVLKTMNDEIDEDDSVFDVLAIKDLDEFKHALTLYSKNRLVSFYDAIQGAIDILIQMDQGNESSELYEVLYVPYYNKLQACQAELDKRQGEIDEVQKNLDTVQSRINVIQENLDFESYLGEYYPLFCAYRREDTYSNSNYISDGLDNAELIKRAKEFLETAKKELEKACEPQYTLSSTLYNLLVLDDFKPIVDYFELGNWIRVKVDGKLYRLRLLSYSLNFDDIQNISVEFSTASKIRDISSEAKNIIHTAQSISSSYPYVSKQAEKGNKAQNSFQGLLDNGLNTGLIQISNNDKEEVIYGKHGILCKALDDVTGLYDDKQLKITHNCIAYTDTAWRSVRQIIGEHSYVTYNEESGQWETRVGYGMTSDFVQGGHVGGSIIVGGKIFSNNYSNNTGSLAGSYINLEDGTFSFAGGGLQYDGTDLIISQKAISESVSNIDVTAENLHVKAENVDGTLGIEKIGGVYAARINGTIESSQIEQGVIKAGSVDATGINGQIQSSQIKSLDSSKLSGTLSESLIPNTLSSKTLSNCTVSGNFSGTLDCDSGEIDSLTVSSLSVMNGSQKQTGITGEYVIGNTTITIVDGIIVGISQQEEVTN